MREYRLITREQWEEIEEMRYEGIGYIDDIGLSWDSLPSIDLEEIKEVCIKFNDMFMDGYCNLYPKCTKCEFVDKCRRLMVARIQESIKELQ